MFKYDFDKSVNDRSTPVFVITDDVPIGILHHTSTMIELLGFITEDIAATIKLSDEAEVAPEETTE